MINNLRPIAQEQRQVARQAARQAVVRSIGPRPAFRKANNRRPETLSQRTQEDWRLAVTREMQADLWYEQSPPGETVLGILPSDTNELTANRNGNGDSPKVFVAAV